MISQKHAVHAKLVESQDRLLQTEKQLDESLKNADNLRDEIADLTSVCNEHTMSFS